MRLDSRARLALVLIAVALLVAGLAGPVTRALETREREARQRAMAEQVSRERADAKARFNLERDRILADLRQRMETADYVGVLKAAAPYGAVDDAELRGLYRDAAQAQSQLLRREHYAKVVERDCTAAAAQQAIAQIFAGAGVAPPPDQPLRVDRLAGAEARSVVLGRLREPPAVDHRHPPAPDASVALSPAAPRDWVARMRDEHRARILADYLGFVHSARADDVICVWRAQGERPDAGRLRAYTLDLWLAPTPDLKGTTADVAAYVERGR